MRIFSLAIGTLLTASFLAVPSAQAITRFDNRPISRPTSTSLERGVLQYRSNFANYQRTRTRKLLENTLRRKTLRATPVTPKFEVDKARAVRAGTWRNRRSIRHFFWENGLDNVK